jgi:hypothetical protein
MITLNQELHMKTFNELNSVGTPVTISWANGFTLEMNNSRVDLLSIPFLFKPRVLAMIRASTTKESLIETLHIFADICKD